jgi:hypothetical protein
MGCMQPPLITKELMRLKLLQKPVAELRCILLYLQERIQPLPDETDKWPAVWIVEKIIALDFGG